MSALYKWWCDYDDDDDDDNDDDDHNNDGYDDSDCVGGIWKIECYEMFRNTC